VQGGLTREQILALPSMPAISPSYPMYAPVAFVLLFLRFRSSWLKTVLVGGSWAMNLPSRGPYRFVNREYFIVTYETDMDSLRRVIPEPLEPISNQVLCTLAVFLFLFLFAIYRFDGFWHSQTSGSPCPTAPALAGSVLTSHTHTHTHTHHTHNTHTHDTL
jgi:hypothetical protein